MRAVRNALKRIVAIGGGTIFKDGPAGCCAAVLMATYGTSPERMAIADIQPDGTDATDAVIGFINACGWRADALMAKSVPIAGFNFIDAGRVLGECGVPSIFVLEEEPDMAAVRRALQEHFADWEVRLRAIEAAGPLHRVDEAGEARFIECVGISLPDALAIVRPLTIFGRLPEPVRLAVMAARAFGRISQAAN